MLSPRIIAGLLSATRNQMSVAVDGRERARWSANFSAITQPVSIAASHGSTVQVERVIVRKSR